MEELQLYIDDADEQMSKSISHLKAELLKIRAGKAMPSMLDGLMVMYYNNPTPLSQVASVSVPDARSIVIKPWEKASLPDIEKAIINSDLGFNPQNDGDIIRIIMPTLTEERRKLLAKQAKNEAENAKIALRNIRKDINQSLKKLQKEGVAEDNIKLAEEKVQAVIDKYSKIVDGLFEEKEKDIMSV